MHLAAKPRHFFFCNPVRGQFIGVEDSPDPAFLGIIRQLAPKPALRLDLAPDQSGKSFQVQGMRSFLPFSGPQISCP